MLEENVPGISLAPAGEDELLNLLANAPVFSVLTPAERREAARMAFFRRYGKGDTIIHHGHVWKQALLVVSGTLRMVKRSPAGRILAAIALGPGQVFFAHSLFDDGPAPASLEAETRASCYLWKAQALNQLIGSNPAALWEVSGALVGLMRRASDIIDDLAFQPLSRRLARLLLDSYGDAGLQPAPRTLTLDDMAARLGTTREVVCRLLYKLADDGLLTITRTEFLFQDRDGLTRLAEAP